MKKWIIMALCLCLVISVTACSQRDDTKEPAISQTQPVSEGQSTPQLSSGSTEDQTSQHGSAPIEEVLPLFEKTMNGGNTYEDPVFEAVDEVSIDGEIWYKFRLTTIYESLLYLTNADISRIYVHMREDQNYSQVTMKEVYSPVEDPLQSLSDEQNEKLSDLLLDRIWGREGDGISVMRDGVHIICEEFCFVMTAAYVKDMETTYVATYAISLDGDRYYKLGDDGFFRTI